MIKQYTQTKIRASKDKGTAAGYHKSQMEKMMSSERIQE